MKSNHRISTWIVSCLASFLFMAPAWGFPQGAQSEPEILTKVADIPLPGPAVRFDYQSLDTQSGRLYIAHKLLTHFGGSPQRK
jgi:hypothetical protein